jgi:uncharacterized SAM-binding protein YcdF (DUF218 family)
MWMFLRIIGFLGAAWIAGLCLYVLQINSYPHDLAHKPEAIVVLTGGSNRIEEGLELMTNLGCPNMFISGVNKDVSRHDILERVQKNFDASQCELELGYTARNTHENAQEVLSWLRKKDYKSMVLVTAHYHMPRSLLEFQAIAPDIAITPYVVTPTHKGYVDSWAVWAGLVIKEYQKYLAALVRIYVFKIYS